jgi:hypothetical protein
MSIAFPRSLRSLNRDTGRATVIGVVVSMLLIITWGAWFVLARSPVYVASSELLLEPDGTLVARFDPATLTRIRQGQQARLLLESDRDATVQILPATVLRTPDPRRDGEGIVLLRLAERPPYVNGELQIAVAYVSPLELLLHSDRP